MPHAWWSKRYGVERACTCARHAQSSECSSRGFHLVDTFDTPAEAIREAAEWTAKIGVQYRAVDKTTWEPLPLTLLAAERSAP